MGNMTWLDIAGGIGKGVSQGTADLREMRNEKLRNDMLKNAAALQQEQLAEHERQRALRTDMKGIRRPGEESFQDSYKDAGAGGEQARMLEADVKDFGQEGADMTRAALGAKGPAKGKKASRSDMLNDTAAVYAKHGEVEKADAATQQARTAGQQEMSDQVVAKFRSYIPMVQRDPVGFLTQFAPEWYKQMVPDGHSAAVQTTPNGLKISVYDDKTSKLIHARDIPPAMLGAAAQDVMEKMYLYEMGQISPEQFRASFEMGLKKQELGTKQQQVAAQAAHWQSQSDLTRAQINTGNWGQQQENAAQARFYDRRPGSDHASNWRIVGTDSDGGAIQQDATTGAVKRLDGAAPKDPKWFQRVTGAKPQAEINPEYIKKYAEDLQNAVTPQDVANVKKKWETAVPGITGGQAKDARIEELRKLLGGGDGKKDLKSSVKDYLKDDKKKEEPKKDSPLGIKQRFGG